jgi:hypothetical protein
MTAAAMEHRAFLVGQAVAAFAADLTAFIAAEAIWPTLNTIDHARRALHRPDRPSSPDRDMP